MLGIRPVMSPIEASTKESPWTGFSFTIVASSPAIAASCPQLPPREKRAATARSALPRAGRMLLLLRRGRCGSGGHCGSGGPCRRRGRHDRRRAVVGEHGQRERRYQEDDGDRGGDLAQDGRSAHGAEHSLAAAASES